MNSFPQQPTRVARRSTTTMLGWLVVLAVTACAAGCGGGGSTAGGITANTSGGAGGGGAGGGATETSGPTGQVTVTVKDVFGAPAVGAKVEVASAAYLLLDEARSADLHF